MKTDDQSEAEKEFRATVLDQNLQPLATATVLVLPSQEEGLIFPISGAPSEHVGRHARFLQEKTGSPVPIYHAHFCTTSGRSHIHFSYVEIKRGKIYEH